MKFNKMLSCFVAFVLICCNLVVSTCSAKLPSSYPVFKFDLELDNNVAPYPWCYILMYNQSSNDYELYIIFNDYEFYNETSLSCYYSSSSSSFLIDRKKLTNLSSVKIYEVLFKTKDKSSIPPVWSGCEIYSQNINTIPFRFSYDDDYPCTNSKHYEIVASNRDIIFNQSNGVSVSGGNLVTFVKGDENYLNSFFADGYKPVYPSFDYQPVTQPSTEPTSSSSVDNTEQIKTSKNILDNVKNLVKSIGSLPSTIYDAVSSALSGLVDKISSIFDLISDFFSSFFTNLFNKLKELLVFLFIPDEDNAFTEIKNVINEKFGFISQFTDLASKLVNLNFSSDVPAIEFTLYDKKYSIIDWSLYQPYRKYIHSIIIVISYYHFIQRTIKRIPSIIGGITSD
ncbi:MAG TPA: hypothetical protein PLY69_08565 [Bacteroidales bacterium]|nr:hypothetical protein [Bacteroidales bacterium]